MAEYASPHSSVYHRRVVFVQAARSIGDGWAVTFKVESHNHPSYVEPYQGAATGVGGIVRDIMAMGARPVAVMDQLRFGAADRKSVV